MTQLELAIEAEISTRHLSFVETGRSRPSAEMLLVLGSALEIPLRERNALLVAAGHAPVYRETDLSASEMQPVRTLLDFMLKQAEPYGAVVVDGSWNLLQANVAAQRFTQTFVEDPASLLALGRPNLLRMLLHPAGVRSRCANWEALSRAMLARAHRELAVTHDEQLSELIDEVLNYEGIPDHVRMLDVQLPVGPMLPMHMRHEGLDLRLYTAITTLGTAQDITLSELRIESFFPADEASAEQLRRLTLQR